MLKPFPGKDALKSPEFFLLASTASGYAFSYLYLVFMGRLLGPEDFGVFGALGGIFFLFAIIGQSLRQVLAAEIASGLGRRDLSAAIRQYKELSRKAVIGGALLTVLLLISSRWVADFFHLDSVVAPLLTALSLFAALFLEIQLGLMQGQQHFHRLGTAGFFIAQGLKLVLGVACVATGWGLNGAIAALLGSSVLAAAIACMWNRPFLTGESPSGTRQSGEPERLLLAALGLAFFTAVPTTVDIMIVAHYFDPASSGIYNATATLGKAIAFLPMAIYFVLLPRASREFAHGTMPKRLLRRGLISSAAILATALIITISLPDALVRLFFGKDYLAARPILVWYAPAMAAFSLNLLLLHYAVAIRRTRLIYWSDALTVLEIGLMFIYHQEMWQPVAVMLLGNIVFFLPALGKLLFREREAAVPLNRARLPELENPEYPFR